MKPAVLTLYIQIYTHGHLVYDSIPTHPVTLVVLELETMDF